MHFLKHISPIVFSFFISFSSIAQVGNPAPDFTVTDTHGNIHTLYDYLEEGKVVVLDFFYTTCGPCQFYSPQVNLAYEKYGCNDANVIFMSIDYDDTDAAVLAYDEEYSIQYPSISGTEGGGNEVVSQYGVFAFPTFYVIDSTKKIIEVIDPPTLQVFDFRFANLGIEPADCNPNAVSGSTNNGSLSIYPNPVWGNVLNITFPENINGTCFFEITDIMGRSMQNGELEINGNSGIKLGFNSISRGMYLLKINSVKSKKNYVELFLIN